MRVVIAVHIDFHLPTIAHNTLPTMLEGHLHVIARGGANIVPNHLGLALCG